MTTPADRRYTKSHEWIREESGELVVGITDHAQSELTDIVFVDLPKSGRAVKRGESVLVLESVKTVADVYAPADGTVSGANSALQATPGLDQPGPVWKRLDLPAQTLLTVRRFRPLDERGVRRLRRLELSEIHGLDPVRGRGRRALPTFELRRPAL